MLTVIDEMAEAAESPEARGLTAPSCSRSWSSAARRRSRGRRSCRHAPRGGCRGRGWRRTRRAPARGRRRVAGEPCPRRGRGAEERHPERRPGALGVPLLHGLRRRGRRLDREALERSSGGSATRCSSSATRARSRCTSTPTIRSGRSQLGRALGTIDGGRDRGHARTDVGARTARAAELDGCRRCETAVVAVAPGAGNRRLFEQLRRDAVIEGGQTMNPSAEEIVRRSKHAQPPR